MEREKIENEIKLIGRRTEETLNIIVDHFRDVDERLEELEDRLEKLENGS
jgi:tetrahydromethanopterin S-methyltransferase subunit G